MSRSNAPPRRVVHYDSLAEIVADAENISAAPHETVGSWSYGQILWHISTAMNASFDGFGFQAPWFVRKLIAPFFRWRFLHKPMSAGFKLPQRAAKVLGPSADISVEEGMKMLRDAVSRFETETPSAPHPVFGPMTPDECLLLHMRHSELHMSFVKPS